MSNMMLKSTTVRPFDETFSVFRDCTTVQNSEMAVMSFLLSPTFCRQSSFSLYKNLPLSTRQLVRGSLCKGLLFPKKIGSLRMSLVRPPAASLCKNLATLLRVSVPTMFWMRPTTLGPVFMVLSMSKNCDTLLSCN